MTSTPEPRIAVLYATAQGSTCEIAEYITEELLARGARAELHDVEHPPDLTGIDAVILGSAVHDRALLPAASSFVRHNLDSLGHKDVWLFSVGLGPALRGPLGRWVGHRVPPEIRSTLRELSPRGYTAFAGRYERAGVSWRAHTVYRFLGGTRYGDLRDWGAVLRWTDDIADALSLAPAQVHRVPPR
ncbi:flavodoxin domain-containing protein [Nocardia thailandica]|uniref:flavodoxin domain-containing protein n=1 Tax=Nocardia thailandica TaxID=257275 RepID=UPI0002FE00C7|nr:flavodoxin domain-containing protein [Nocardia thailandica]